MNAKISKLFLLVISLLMIPVGISAKGKDKKNAPTEQVATWQGIYLSGDVFGLVFPIFLTDPYYSTELSATLNLKNRFMPTVEVGWGQTNMTSELHHIHYATRAPYYRIGMDYNMMHKKGAAHYIYLGLRAGYSYFNYDVNATHIKDPIWETETSLNINNVPCHAVWGEAVAGIRTEIYKNFYMGWSLRYKLRFHTNEHQQGGPWYVPGFGINNKSSFGATYTLTYYFRLNRDK